MRVLGIDTATWTASVGIVEEEVVLAERSLAVADSHAISLLPLVDATLASARLRLADIELLAVSSGPGSFTGLRIGLSVAKGLALATGVAVVGVPTLEALAYAAGPRPGLICPLLDARRGEVYAAIFRRNGGGLTCVREAAVLAPQRLVAQLVPPCTLVGDGVDAYGPLLRSRVSAGVELVPFAGLSPRGPVVARLGAQRLRRGEADDVARLEPTYVRISDAERNRGVRP